MHQRSGRCGAKFAASGNRDTCGTTERSADWWRCNLSRIALYVTQCLAARPKATADELAVVAGNVHRHSRPDAFRPDLLWDTGGGDGDRPTMVEAAEWCADGATDDLARTALPADLTTTWATLYPHIKHWFDAVHGAAGALRDANRYGGEGHRWYVTGRILKKLMAAARIYCGRTRYLSACDDAGSSAATDLQKAHLTSVMGPVYAVADRRGRPLDVGDVAATTHRMWANTCSDRAIVVATTTKVRRRRGFGCRPRTRALRRSQRRRTQKYVG